jgi:mono/diheme cytochrome c family protein
MTIWRRLPRVPSGGFDANPAAGERTMTALKTGVPEYPGAGIYRSFCARCHQEDGSGVAQKYPRLAGNPAVIAENPASLIRLLTEGGSSPTTIDGPTARRMPSFAGKLTDAEMAHVLTFVRNAWGNAAAPVTARDVELARNALHK